MSVFGCGDESLSSASPIRQSHGSEVWGINMYRAVARSRITLNRHTSSPENNASNMRFHEVSWAGAMLMIDREDNQHELFATGKGIVTCLKGS